MQNISWYKLINRNILQLKEKKIIKYKIFCVNKAFWYNIFSMLKPKRERKVSIEVLIGNPFDFSQYFKLFEIYLFCIFEILPTCKCVYHVCDWYSLSYNRVSNPLKLGITDDSESQNTGNWTQVFRKSRKFSKLLSNLSSPIFSSKVWKGCFQIGSF